MESQVSFEFFHFVSKNCPWEQNSWEGMFFFCDTIPQVVKVTQRNFRGSFSGKKLIGKTMRYSKKNRMK